MLDLLGTADDHSRLGIKEQLSRIYGAFGNVAEALSQDRRSP
jgi:hypothetical protein